MWASLGNKCSLIISVHHFEKVLFSAAVIFLKNTKGGREMQEGGDMGMYVYI